jgi:hypothetical protein
MLRKPVGRWNAAVATPSRPTGSRARLIIGRGARCDAVSGSPCGDVGGAVELQW